VRGLLQQGPTGGFGSVEAFANALQDAVRRTGTVVARQSIGAQVRGVCEQYLLERRRQVRGLRETEWGDQRESLNARNANGAGAAPANGAPSADELEMQAAAGEDEAPALNEYDESSDDAVTRIYDGEELEKDGSAQPQAWMHDSRPPESVRSGWSRWAVVTLLGVLVAVASGAAFMASRSVARTPAAVPSAEARVAAASAGESRKPAAATEPVVERTSAADDAADGTLAAVRGQEPAANDDEAKPAAVVEDDESGDDDAAEKRTGRRAVSGSGPVLRRVAAAPRRSRPAARSTPAQRSAPAQRGASAQPSAPAASDEAAREEAPRPGAEPATVAVLDLPEAREEDDREEPARAPQPPAAPSPARPAAPAADGDLVIEEGPKVAFLSVDATPYATVFIDGEKKGITPLVRLELAPGLHRMIARTEDGRTKRFTLQLDPGKTETVKVSWEE
jgi:hypothetical protein